MNRKNIIFEIILFAAILAAMFFVFRFWIGVLLATIGLFVLLIVLFVLAVRQRRAKPASTAASEEAAEEAADGYAAILNRITQLVHDDHPQAKWVWAQPDTQKRLASGEDVYVLLSGAGGYARAKVVTEHGNVIALEYPQRREAAQQPQSEDCDPMTERRENYDLVAYEWVEAHIQNLNERCNETLGQGKQELLLQAEELPLQESWVSICRELKRNDLPGAECVPSGIKIRLA